MKIGWGILGTAALAVSLPLSGCSNACTTIGYVSTLTVNLEGDASTVDEVRICAGEVCSVSELPSASPRIVVQESLDAKASPTPAPEPSPSYYGARADADTWVFTFTLGPHPEHVSVRALAEDGTVLAEQENDLVWTRTGGTAQCGGPVTTPPITLAIGKP